MALYESIQYWQALAAPTWSDWQNLSVPLVERTEVLDLKMFPHTWKEKRLMKCKHCISNLREFHLFLFLLLAQLLLSLHHCGVCYGNFHDRDRDADAKIETSLTLVDSGSTLLVSICRLYSSIQKLTCLLLATHVQVVLSASASVLLWTVSGWFPGQHLMNQREAYH